MKTPNSTHKYRLAYRVILQSPSGTFAMKVLMDPMHDNKEPNNSFRQQPDTVLITNGEYRILLEENG